MSDIHVGTDGIPEYPPRVGDNMAVTLSGTDEYRIAEAFVALADGGQVKPPLAEQPRGGKVGWLVDKFGITWQVSVGTVT